MSVQYTLRCSKCQATAARRRDRVSEQATGYVCSPCLLGGPPGSAPEPTEPAPDKARDCSRSSRLVQRLRARARDRAARARRAAVAS
jgi:hypothetical protein